MTNKDIAPVAPIKWLVVGKLGRVHGLKGFITIHSFTEPRDNILQYKHWYIKLDNEWQELKIIATEITNKNIYIQISGYSTPELVNNLVNTEVAIKDAYLPLLNDGEYYCHQLIDLEVVNQDGVILGKVIEIMPTGGNDVLVVLGEKKHLIPYLVGYSIIAIDLDQKIIRVDWDKNF